MTTSTTTFGGRALLGALMLALTALVLARLAIVVPHWIAGTPPAYPGQYVGRLYFALTEVPLLAASWISLNTRTRPTSLWRLVVPWVLLAVSFTAMALDARRG